MPRQTLPQRVWSIASVVLLFICLMLSATAIVAQKSGTDTVRVYLFWQQGCPHCAGAVSVLNDIAVADPSLELILIELGRVLGSGLITNI